MGRASLFLAVPPNLAVLTSYSGFLGSSGSSGFIALLK